MKEIKFTVPIYNIGIVYVVTKDLVKYMKKKNVKLEEGLNECKGLCLPMDKEYDIHILINKNKYDVGTVVHECLHATNQILESKGIKVSLKNDEAQTYLLGYIINRIL